MAMAVKGAYWMPEGRIQLRQINLTYYTHLFFAFADVGPPPLYHVTVSQQNNASFTDFSPTLHQMSASVKTMLSIGGGDAQVASRFADMAAQLHTRGTFIQSSIILARNGGFDGIDLDWEFPKNDAQMNNFAQLVSELRAAIEVDGRGRTKLLLTAAVFRKNLIHFYNALYPVVSMRENLDWINVMAYDFYGAGWSDKAGPLAPLHREPGEDSAVTGIHQWIDAGMPADKLVLGLAFYGRGFVLQNPNNHAMWAPTIQGQYPPSPIGEAAIYPVIRRAIEENNAIVVYDQGTATRYCFWGTTWISYDDVDTIREKVAFARNSHLKGYFSWHVGGDNDNWDLSRAASNL